LCGAPAANPSAGSQRSDRPISDVKAKEREIPDRPSSDAKRKEQEIRLLLAAADCIFYQLKRCCNHRKEYSFSSL
jgi:hypothetical protein